MKCHFRLDDGQWIKGNIYSLHGNREVHFTSEPCEDMPEFYLVNSEIGFSSAYFCVTGYAPIGPDNRTYKLISVDVSGGWVKPKK